jgi:hypothetical protein
MDTNDDYNLVLFLSSTGPCSLNKSPKKNWVDKAGHLPNYICHIAKAVGKHGHSTSGSIAIAIGTVKKWAAGGGGVNADTRAKAARAVAQWEALKAKAHAGHMVKASNAWGQDFITLASEDGSYNMEVVREAWERAQSIARFHEADMDYDQRRAANPVKPGTSEYADVAEGSYSYIREVWSDFIIVQVSGPEDIDNYKVPYTVDAAGDVNFGAPVRVKQAWDEQADDEPNDEELALLQQELALYHSSDEVKLSAPLGPRKVRTLEGARKFGEPVGHTIVPNEKGDGKAPATVTRLISLYRHYKQVKAAGDTDGAEAALHALNVALDDFPATKDNKAQLAKIRKLVNG